MLRYAEPKTVYEEVKTTTKPAKVEQTKEEMLESIFEKVDLNPVKRCKYCGGNH